MAGAAGTAAQARAEILAALRERSPYAIGSYAFWLTRDEHLFAGAAARRPGAPGSRRCGLTDDMGSGHPEMGAHCPFALSAAGSS